MPSDYDAIRQKNINDHRGLVERVGLLLATNYSDKTHFIFELLQNAEDVNATRIVFNLYKDRLEVEHNGDDFTNDDVEAICKLVFTTKADDEFKIGKFGIGFMSVYDFTRSPCIHSGDEHFRIENYEEPRKVDVQRCSDLGTLFVFPFDHAKKTPDQSYTDIEKGLRDLDLRNLLFLSNIGEISYMIDGESGGTYLRETLSHADSEIAANVTLLGQRDGEVQQENWLTFSRDVTHLVENGSEIPASSNLSVQIAFQCSTENDGEMPCIQRLDNSPLSIFFPTALETHLGFLVHGPFSPTLTRDNIKSPDPEGFDNSLAKETGELVVQALRWLRDKSWLTVGVLETMPLDFGKFYDSLLKPVYDRVQTAITDEALIPAYTTDYIPGNDAVMARSRALRDVLNGTQLQQLFETDKQIAWVSEAITSGLTPRLHKYLTQSYQIGIEEIGAEQFASRIEEEFLARQSDHWIREFYEYASTFDSRSYLYSSAFNTIKRKPIIRLEDGSHVQPFDRNEEPQGYLPKEHESRYSTIKREVCSSDKSLEFLKRLGLKEPDIVDEVLTQILPDYKSGQEIDNVKHQEDIALIVQALREVDSLERRNALVSALESTPFLLAENTFGRLQFRKPDDIIYFRNPTLEMYFEGNPDAWFITERYEQYCDELKQLEVFDGVVYWRKEPNYEGYVILEQGHGWHVRGLNGFDPNFRVDGLEFAVKHPSIQRAEFIWNVLLAPRKHLIAGEVESCTRQTFVGSNTEWQVSKAGELVCQMAWLPDGNGNFVKPSELSLEDLLDDFRQDDELADALGMDVNRFNIDDAPDDIKAKLAAAEGRSPEELKEALDLLDEQRQREQESVEVLEPDEYPNHLEGDFEQSGAPTPPAPSNPDFDSLDGDPDERFIEDVVSEPDPEERYRIGLRRIWETENRATRRFFENEYGGLCQICNSTFPKRNGAPYFEAVHLIPRTSARWLDHPRNALCLCADHSAQFQHGERSTPDSDIIDQIRSYDGGSDHQISIVLCDQPVKVRFFARHIRELCVAAGGSNCL